MKRPLFLLEELQIDHILEWNPGFRSTNLVSDKIDSSIILPLSTGLQRSPLHTMYMERDQCNPSGRAFPSSPMPPFHSSQSVFL